MNPTTETPNIRMDGANTFSPFNLLSVRDEGGALMTAKEAFSLLQWEDYEKDLKTRFPALATKENMDIVYCSWWSGWSAGRTGDVDVDSILQFNAQQAAKKSAELDEDAKCFTLLHSRSAWFSGHRAAKRAATVQEVAI